MIRTGEKLSPFLAPILCLFSRSAYKSVANEWKGFGGLYALGIVTASWLALAPQMYLSSSKWIGDSTDYVLSALPSLSLENGKLSCSVEMPIELTDPQTGTIFAIVDTRIAQPPPDFSPPATPFALVTSDRIVYFRNTAETRIMEFSSAPDFSLNANQLREWSDLASKIFVPTLLALVIPLFYLFYLAKTLLWTTLALLVVHVLRKDWAFGKLYRLCIVSSTPALLLSTAIDVAQVCGWMWPLGLLVTTAYVVFATSSLEPKNAVEPKI